MRSKSAKIAIQRRSARRRPEISRSRTHWTDRRSRSRLDPDHQPLAHPSSRLRYRTQAMALAPRGRLSAPLERATTAIRRFAPLLLATLASALTAQCGSRTALRELDASVQDGGSDAASSPVRDAAPSPVRDASVDAHGDCGPPLPSLLEPADGTTVTEPVVRARLAFAPVPDVTVELCGDPECSVVLDTIRTAEEEVSFTGVPSGTYYLRLSRGACATPAIRVLVELPHVSSPPLIDVNGDGFDDVVVGADLSNAVFAFHGPVLESPTSADVTLRGTIFEYGYRLAVPGDLDGDGFDDVVVGGRADRVFVHRGSAEGLEPEPVLEVRNDGDSVPEPERAGDVNGDGLVDVLVSFKSQCRVELWLGGAGSMLSRIDAIARDSCGSHTSEWAARGGADFQGDGLSDFVHVEALEGIVTVFAGAPGSLLPTGAPLEVPGGFELEARPAGDLDGDGQIDLAVVTDDPRRLHVFWGSPDGFVPSASTVLDLPRGPRRGRHVAAAGDVDGDGLDDLALGSNGALLLIFGRRGARELDLVTFPSPSGRSDFGTPVAGLGDLNLDGRPDIAVGATYGEPHEVALVSVDPFRSVRVFANLSGPTGGGRFGIAIAGR